jgi:hypothetical protein
VTASEEEKQQRQQQQNQELITLDDIINELKNGDNSKIEPYDLLSGFVTYLEEEEGVENPNTIRYYVTTARNFLEYNDVEITPRKFKLKVRLPKGAIESFSKGLRIPRDLEERTNTIIHSSIGWKQLFTTTKSRRTSTNA